MPGLVLNPEGKKPAGVGKHVVKSLLAFHQQAFACGHPACMAIEDLEQQVSSC